MALGGASPSGPNVLGAIVRHRGLVLASVVISVALTILLGAILPGSPREVAVASLVVSGSTGSEIAATDRPERFVANQVEVIRSSRVTQRALQLLRDHGIADITATDLQSNLLVVDQENSDQIVVSYSDPEGPVALAVVNAVLEAYRDIRRELTDIVADEAVNRVDAELELLDQRLATISADIEELESIQRTRRGPGESSCRCRNPNRCAPGRVGQLNRPGTPQPDHR